MPHSLISVLDGEPRVLDLDIGRMLGLTPPSLVEDLIERNQDAMTRLGRRIEGTGGREFFNEGQAVFLAIVSPETASRLAALELIEAFAEHRANSQRAAAPIAIDRQGWLPVDQVAHLVARRKVEMRDDEQTEIHRLATKPVRVIRDSSLYRSLLNAPDREAKRFQEWIAREVLPAIRRTGYYATPHARRSNPRMFK